MVTNEIRTTLDKFYTKQTVADSCFEKLTSVLKSCGIDLSACFFIEPSAGNGRLLDAISTSNKIGFDLLPEREDIIECDYLKLDIKEFIPKNKHLVNVAYCNPPFGKKSNLAILFLNKLLKECDYIAAILPVEFNKYSVQSKINSSAKLIYSLLLPPDSFTFGDSDKTVNCSFQIWTRKKTTCRNLRLATRPATEISDFEMYQYNCTPTAEKFFEYEWDFAVRRQGYDSQEFENKYYSYDELKLVENYLSKQWIFFKSNSEECLKNLLTLDFKKLSEKNTSSAKGFGKADVVEEYTSIFSKTRKKNIRKFMKG